MEKSYKSPILVSPLFLYDELEVSQHSNLQKNLERRFFKKECHPLPSHVDALSNNLSRAE